MSAARWVRSGPRPAADALVVPLLPRSDVSLGLLSLETEAAVSRLPSLVPTKDALPARHDSPETFVFGFLAHVAEAVADVESDDADEASNAADALWAAADEVQSNDNV